MTSFNKNILATLSSIEGTGNFVSHEVLDFSFPGLEIIGLDELAFPLNSIQIKEIIKMAHKAPFGKGSQTVIDPNVRSAWEIDADQIVFNNKSWSNTIKHILEEIKPQLGIDNQSISANLYKMLIYEEGDFFLAHKDSEKEKGMFGTLIIGLPAKHTGGELMVRFDGREEIIDFSETASKSKMPYVAFYADCEHEIKPITSGYRVCLVYNLVQDKVKEKLSMNHLGDHVKKLAAILKSSEDDEVNIPKIILLGHQYTPSNFTMDSLKLNDRPKADALLQAAESVGFYAKLGLVTCYQNGELEASYSGKGSRRRSYYDDDDDDIDVENSTMGEVYDETIEVEHWMAGGIPPIRDIQFSQEDLITDIELFEDEPSEKAAEGYTGNAGMSMEYWYHYGAVFVCPKKYVLDLLSDSNVHNKLEWIDYYNQNWNRLRKEDIAQLKTFIETPSSEKSIKDIDFGALVGLLINLNDEQYFADKGTELLQHYFTSITTEKWVEIFNKYPINHFDKVFRAVAQKDKISITERSLEILMALYLENTEKYSNFISQQLAFLPANIGSLALTKVDKKAKVKSILTEVLFWSIMLNDDEEWTNEITESLTKTLTRDYVNDVLIPVLKTTHKAQKKSVLIENLTHICQQDLAERVSAKPQPPADWTRAVPQGKQYHQKLWDILTPFLISPTQQIFEYRQVQSSRTDMESAIRNVEIDLKMETIKKGSPHLLLITKIQSAYEKEYAKWQLDTVYLAEVEKW